VTVSRRIVLCADDYAIAPGVSRAIRELAAGRRISATSCMTVMPSWPEEGRRLGAMAAGIDVGVHVTLTDHRPLARMPVIAPQARLPPFGVLLRRAYRGAVDRGEIRAEIERQIDAFESVMGRRPDFLDGHHHAHQLPVIREIVAEVFRARVGGRRAYVRTCAESWGTIVRRRVSVGRAAAFSIPGRALRRVLDRHGVPSNHGYAGAYDFSSRVPYETLFRRMLTSVRDGTLINCHPGFVDEDLGARDTLTAPRETEYRFFSGPAFPGLLDERGLSLGWAPPEGSPRAAGPRTSG
jgi:predicted glycoside hydrolase/deacetylase ChbG (UPF0249 family)